jgi:flagellar basal-body rod modification protein FlgD
MGYVIAGSGGGPGSISSVTNVNQPSASPTPQADSLGPNDFLQLLTTELANQDPTQPQDPTQSVTQLAQFSALQYTQQLTSAFQTFQSNFSVTQAASLLGKTATVNTGTQSAAGAASSNVTGTITSIDVQNGVPYFTMNSSAGTPIEDNNGNQLLFSTTNIVGIG